VRLQESTGIVRPQKKGLMTSVHATLAAAPLVLRGVPAPPPRVRSCADWETIFFEASVDCCCVAARQPIVSSVPSAFLLAGIVADLVLNLSSLRKHVVDLGWAIAGPGDLIGCLLVRLLSSMSKL
jgi:hypothetical protein